MSACRILLVDGHGVVRRGLRSLLESQTDWEVVGEANGGEEAVEMAKLLKPNIVIMETSSPALNLLDVAHRILSSEPEIGIMVFTIHDTEQSLRMAAEAGVRGYVLKSDPEDIVIECVQKICDGGVYFSSSIAQVIMASPASAIGQRRPSSTELSSLTPRQLEVLRLLARGKTNKEIARDLGISSRTVDAHRTHLKKRLNVHSLSELVILALRNHLIEI